jgi:hypothetical protein
MHERITLEDNIMSMLTKMAEGNPGAVGAMMSIIEDKGKIDPDDFMGSIGAILSLDSIGIYGTDIYVLWSDICDKKTNKMLAVLRSHQLGYLTESILKDACSRQDRSGKAMIDVEGLYKKVCKYLPNFDKANR